MSRPPPQRWYPSNRPECADPGCGRLVRPDGLIRAPYFIAECECGQPALVLTTVFGMSCVVGLTAFQAQHFRDPTMSPADMWSELGLLQGQRKAS